MDKPIRTVKLRIEKLTDLMRSFMELIIEPNMK